MFENFDVYSTYREAHFWYILPNEVENPLLLNHYLELVSPTERDNALRMNGDQLQKGALLSRVLLRTTLAKCKEIYFSNKPLHRD